MTPRQAAVLDKVIELIAMGELAPTYQELASHLGIARTQAFAAVQALVAMGRLIRGPEKVRNLRLPGRPDLRAVATGDLAAELARRGVTPAALNPRAPRAYGRHAVTCASDYCGAAVQRGHLFCREHWFVLPGELRDRILRCFGRRDVTGYQAAVAEARDVIEGAGSWGDREQAA